MSTPVTQQAVARLREALDQAEGHESQAVLVKCADLRAALAGDAGEDKAEAYERRQHIETLTYLQTQYLPGGPRDIKGALRAAVNSLGTTAPAPADQPSRIDAIDSAIRIGIFNTCMARGMSQNAAIAIVRGTMEQLCVASALAKGKEL